MPCTHKFFGHQNHLLGANGLLPNWDADTLIIGTFNPCNEWVPDNQSNYFYGRSQYFWRALPRFACHPEIDKEDNLYQIDFLQKKRIALTDLLISINDADENDPQHIAWVNGYLDNDLMNFNDFTWNTPNIIRFIQDKKIKAVYFTKLGGDAPFGAQMETIEDFCNVNNILNFRLHTPTGQGLRHGIPRIRNLINRWYHHNGGHQFPFLRPQFDINAFPLADFKLKLKAIDFTRPFIKIPVIYNFPFENYHGAVNLFLGAWGINQINAQIVNNLNHSRVILLDINYLQYLQASQIVEGELLIFLNNPQYPNSILIQ